MSGPRSVARGQRAVEALLLACALLLGACAESTGPKRAGPGEACEKPRDCVYGTECRAKKCELISFSDCDGDTTPSGASQCLSGQKCRDNHCTVQCIGTAECKEGQICRIGICVKGNKDLQQCTDNRDCPWPETCFYGQCVTRSDSFRCVSDIDCGAGYRCINGRCI